MATTIFQDSFTEGSDTALSSHTPDVGTSWSLVWQTGASSKATVIASTDRCRTDATVANSGVMYSADATYSTADYEVSAVISAGWTGTNKLYLIVRMQDQENMYALRIGTGASNTRMYKKVAGTWSAIGSFMTDPSIGDTVKIRVSGTTLTWYINGTLKDTQTASDHSAAGKAGIAMGGGAELAAATDDLLNTSAIDDFLVKDLVNGPNAPTSLTATQNGAQADLAWTDNATDETGFVVERKRGGSPNYYQIATPAANATSYSDTTVDPGYTYTYRIKARNGSGDSTYATSSDMTMTGTKKWTSHIGGWIFVGQANAQTQLQDGNVRWSVKPEFGTLNNSGVYSTPTGFVNGYDDPTMISNALAHSLFPYFTVSANVLGMSACVADPTLRTNCINGILAVLSGSGFTGVELDWEGYGDWTPTDYTNYKSFVTDLCTAVHAVGKKVIICGPPIGTALEQSYYPWLYEDFESSSVDYVLPLAYDWNFDFGSGTPIAPTARVQNVCAWMRAKISDPTRVIIGYPGYGYFNTTGAFTGFTNITEAQAMLRTGYPGTRDPNSFEMFFADSGVTTFYCDQTAVNSKREMIEDEGFTNLCEWHLGDNPWPNGRIELDSFTTPRTITGKASILRTVARTITGLSRLQKTAQQTIAGVANIAVSIITTTKTVTGKSRVQKAAAQTVTGLARVAKSAAQTITGRSRVQTVVPKTVTGLSRITVANPRTITGQGRISKAAQQTISGIATIAGATTRTITGLARVAGATLQTLTGTSRVTKAAQGTVTGLSRIGITRDGNVLFNGDFETAPAVNTAATTIAARYIDGTSGGSASTSYGWAIPGAGVAASAGAAFDSSVTHGGSYSMRLSTLNSSGTITVSTFKDNPPTSGSLQTQGFVLLPSSTYTIIGWIKTNNVATNGAFIDLRQFDETGSNIATSSSTKRSGTSDWTRVSFTVTTGATAKWGSILLRNNVAGNVSDAWFDDILVLGPNNLQGISRITQIVPVVITGLSRILKSVSQTVTGRSRIQQNGPRRTNLVTNPSMEGATGWSQQSSNGTLYPVSQVIRQSTLRPLVGTYSLLIPNNTTAAHGYSSIMIDVVPGQVYTFSAWVYLDNATAGSISGTIKNSGQSVTYGSIGNISTYGQWVRVSSTCTPLVTPVRFILEPNGTYVGDLFVDAVMCEAGAGVNPYFDGSFPGASWTGTANNSSSTMSGMIIQGKSRIQKQAAQTITGRSRIAVSVPQTVTGRARLQKTALQTIPGKSRIMVGNSQIVHGTALISVEVNTRQETITGTAHICVDEWQVPAAAGWQQPAGVSWQHSNVSSPFTDC